MSRHRSLLALRSVQVGCLTVTYRKQADEWTVLCAAPYRYNMARHPSQSLSRSPNITDATGPTALTAPLTSADPYPVISPYCSGGQRWGSAAGETTVPIKYRDVPVQAPLVAHHQPVDVTCQRQVDDRFIRRNGLRITP